MEIRKDNKGRRNSIRTIRRLSKKDYLLFEMGEIQDTKWEWEE